MNLVDLWFWLIALTFTLYFSLEGFDFGFDFGVDILRPTLARNEADELSADRHQAPGRCCVPPPAG